MSLPLPLLLAKNKIADGKPWLLLVDFILPDSTVLYLARNNEPVAYGGHTYVPAVLQLDSRTADNRGTLPNITMRIENIDGMIQAYLEETNGLRGATVTIRQVYTDALDADTSDLALTLAISGGKADENWVYLNLKAPSPLRRRFPAQDYYAGQCPFVRHYRGAECAYAGAEPVGQTACSGSLQACRERGNTARYGGNPGLDAGGIRVA